MRSSAHGCRRLEEKAVADLAKQEKTREGKSRDRALKPVLDALRTLDAGPETEAGV